MTFDRLRDFLLKRMSMSHLYQPLVIRTLVENGGRASVRVIAREFLAYDEAQVAYYTRIVKRWPKITLTKHGIIDASERGNFRLSLDLASLTDAQRAEIVGICNEKIRRYIEGYKGIIGTTATTLMPSPPAVSATWCSSLPTDGAPSAARA